MSQISLTFPDGNSRQYPAGVTAAEVAASIAPSLAKAAISAQLDGAHYDLAWPITADAAISINTMKDAAPASLANRGLWSWTPRAASTFSTRKTTACSAL